MKSLDEPFFEELSKLADCADVHFMRNIHHPRSISISHAGDPVYHVAQLEDGQFAYGESTRNEKIFFTFYSPDLDLVTRWFDIPVRDLLDSFLDPDGRPALEAFIVEE
ncbi:MAG: hypothetical protein E6244_09720 [Actinomyces sp.]|nr:hypothetical protein [Actinomyces sp.]